MTAERDRLQSRLERMEGALEKIEGYTIDLADGPAQNIETIISIARQALKEKPEGEE